MERDVRKQKWFERHLLKREFRTMRELWERPQYVDYMTGRQIPAREFSNGGLDIFGIYVYPDVVKEHAGAQLSLPIEGFEGDVYYTKNRPIEIKSPQQEKLEEVRPLKNGVARLI